MKIRLGVWLLVASLLAATPAIAQKAPGVTDTEVVIGLTMPLSGPAAAWSNTGVAMEAWTRYVNDQGGIHGRKLKVVMKDDGYNPGRAVANLEEMKDQVFMSVGLLGSAILQASKDKVAEFKLPTINPYGNPAIWAKQSKDKLRYVFVAYTDYGDEGDFLVSHAVNKLGASKVAVFYQNDEYGKGGLEGVNRGLKSLGGKGSLATTVAYELADREMGTHALKLKDSGADTVILYSTITHGANVVKEMAKVGYRPKIVSSFPLGDYSIMYRLLGELWEGAHFNALNAAAVAGDPAAKPIGRTGEHRARRGHGHHSGGRRPQEGRAKCDARVVRRGHGADQELRLDGVDTGDDLRAGPAPRAQRCPDVASREGGGQLVRRGRADSDLPAALLGFVTGAGAGASAPRRTPWATCSRSGTSR